MIKLPKIMSEKQFKEVNKELERVDKEIETRVSLKEQAEIRLKAWKEKAKPFIGKKGYNPYVFLTSVEFLFKNERYDEILKLDEPDFKV